MSNSKDFKKLYHYTDVDSAKKISKSGEIRQSTGNRGDDITFGPGAYFTDKPPSDGRHSIAKNNYDDGPKLPKMRMEQGKVDAVVEVSIRKDKIQDHSESGRSVHKYPGNVDLKGPDVKSYKVYKTKSEKK